MEWYLYPAAMGVGLFAGVINTLAGSGSLVTLPLLVLLGLPSTVANATNRVGVVVQNVVGVVTFPHNFRTNLANAGWLIAATVPGGVAGALVAARLTEAQMDLVIGGVMVVMLLILLYQPDRVLRGRSTAPERPPRFWTLLAFVAIGFYAGFIQAGVSVYILAALVMGLQFDLVHATAVRLVAVLVVTVVALLIFTNAGLVYWGIGLMLAIGQSIGAWIGVRLAIYTKRARPWARRLLIAIIALAIVQFFDLLSLVRR